MSSRFYGITTNTGMSSPIDPVFSILTTLRWDPIVKGHPDCAYGAPYYLLSHHRKRLLNAVKYFHEQGASTEGVGRWSSILKWLENETEFEKDMLVRLVDTGVSLDGPLRVTVMKFF